ncbi:MAG: hypothetical protein K0Q70_1669, partial [Rhodospirillales bacterium]|nr:hypothetical protein [Rhodospirillales bacterium]
MEFLGPAITVVGVVIVVVAAILWSKKKDRRSARERDMDQISDIRG